MCQRARIYEQKIKKRNCPSAPCPQGSNIPELQTKEPPAQGRLIPQLSSQDSAKEPHFPSVLHHRHMSHVLCHKFINLDADNCHLLYCGCFSDDEATGQFPQKCALLWRLVCTTQFVYSNETLTDYWFAVRKNTITYILYILQTQNNIIISYLSEIDRLTLSWAEPCKWECVLHQRFTRWCCYSFPVHTYHTSKNEMIISAFKLLLFHFPHRESRDARLHRHLHFV